MTRIKQAHAKTESVSADYNRLKIGEVSKISGIGIETLRFYEKSGLLDHPIRTQSGYRIYDQEVFERLGFIRRAQSLGLTLNEISQIIAEKRAGQSPCKHVRALVRLRLEEIDRRLIEMKRDRDELETTLTEWDKAGEVKGHVCGLIEGTHLNSQPDIPRRPSGLTNKRIGTGRRPVGDSRSKD